VFTRNAWPLWTHQNARQTCTCICNVWSNIVDLRPYYIAKWDSPSNSTLCCWCVCFGSYLDLLYVVDIIHARSFGSSVSTETRLGAWRPGFNFRSGQWWDLSLICTASRPALGFTQPPIQWVLGCLTPPVKRPGSEAEHSSPSNAEIKNEWRCTSSPPIRIHGVVLN